MDNMSMVLFAILVIYHHPKRRENDRIGKSWMCLCSKDMHRKQLHDIPDIHFDKDKLLEWCRMISIRWMAFFCISLLCFYVTMFFWIQPVIVCVLILFYYSIVFTSLQLPGGSISPTMYFLSLFCL